MLTTHAKRKSFATNCHHHGRSSIGLTLEATTDQLAVLAERGVVVNPRT